MKNILIIGGEKGIGAGILKIHVEKKDNTVKTSRCFRKNFFTLDLKKKSQ